MAIFVFRSTSGNLVEVSASDETGARKVAMAKLYGTPKPVEAWLGSEWLGRGLSLQSAVAETPRS